MAFKPPPPAVSPAKPKAAPASGLPPAKPKAPSMAPAAPATPAAPPPFVPPARPKMAALLLDTQPADHFAPHDPVQATTGVRQNPPADEQASVPADGTMQLPQPLDWQPFSNQPR